VDSDLTGRVAWLEADIARLTGELTRAKEIVQTWTNASTNLSRSAAEERAKNQGAGRGFFGGLLGSKYRSIVRAGAAASNAAIAQDVAQKRSQISDGKREAQELVRQIQQQLSSVRQELKHLSTGSKEKVRAKASAAKAASESLDLLHKLKEAHQAGLLTDNEYEEKRQKLLAHL
jgi:hypothetical protein